MTPASSQKQPKDFLQLERFAAIGRMAAFLAHDLRNPLHAIASTSELALEGLGKEDPRRE